MLRLLRFEVVLGKIITIILESPVLFWTFGRRVGATAICFLENDRRRRIRKILLDFVNNRSGQCLVPVESI